MGKRSGLMSIGSSVIIKETYFLEVLFELPVINKSFFPLGNKLPFELLRELDHVSILMLGEESKWWQWHNGWIGIRFAEWVFTGRHHYYLYMEREYGWCARTTAHSKISFALIIILPPLETWKVLLGWMFTGKWPNPYQMLWMDNNMFSWRIWWSWRRNL